MAYTMIMAVRWRKTYIFAKCLQVEPMAFSDIWRTRKEDDAREVLRFLAFADGQL